MKISRILRKSPVYVAIQDMMMGYQYAYLGGPLFKTSVRKKRPSEDSVIHTDLIKNTVAQPICRYIVDSINDVLFEPGVKRMINFASPEGRNLDIESMGWAELFMLDADLQNRTLTGFMEQVGDLTSIFGHCWVGVDMPTVEQGNLGRPYLCAISPLDVWDWEFELYGGRPILKYIKIKERETADCMYFKCYHLGTQTEPTSWISYEVEKDENVEHEAKVTGEGYFPPGMGIPVFIAYGRRDPRTIDVGVSDIDAASEAQREHYKLECEAYQSIQFAKTIIRADNGVKVPAHAGAIVRATQGQIETISVDTGDVDKIISKQQDILEQIEALTGLGGLRATKTQVQSGISIIEERKQLHRIAKAKAREMEITEEQIWTYAARFMNMRWAGEVVYGTDYEQHDTNYRLALLEKAKNLMPENDIVQGMILQEVVAMLAPKEEVQEYLMAVNPMLPAQIQAINNESQTEIYTRDIGSQIPDNAEREAAIGDGEHESQLDNVMGSDSIEDVGQSYWPQQAVAIQLQGLNTGR